MLWAQTLPVLHLHIQCCTCAYSCAARYLTQVDAKHVELHLDEEKPEGVVNEVGEAWPVCFNQSRCFDERRIGCVGGWLVWAPVVRCNAPAAALHLSTCCLRLPSPPNHVCRRRWSRLRMQTASS